MWAWTGSPTILRMVARSRTTHSGAERVLLENALQMGKASAVVSLGVAGGDVCAVVSAGPHEQEVICSKKETKAEVSALENPIAQLEPPRCGVSGWPCFSSTDAAATAFGYYRCGVDGLGQPWCAGEAPVASLEPPAGEGYTLVVAGTAHACALHAEHYLSCWGDNRRKKAPRLLEDVADVAASGSWTCVLDLDSRILVPGEEGAAIARAAGAPVVSGA